MSITAQVTHAQLHDQGTLRRLQRGHQGVVDTADAPQHRQAAPLRPCIAGTTGSGMTMAIGKRSALTAIMVFLTLGETGSVEQELPWGSQAFFRWSF